MPRRLKRIVLTAIAAMAIVASSAMAAPSASSAWVVLDSGRQGDYLWSVKATRGGGDAEAGSQSDARRPCLLIGTKWLRGRFSYSGSHYRQCADASSNLAVGEAPLVSSGLVPGGAAGPQLTVVGMIVSERVRRLRVVDADGTTSSVGTERFSSEGLRSGLKGFRYAAFSVRGRWCPQRLVSVGGSGRTLWEGPPEKHPC